MRPVVSLRIPGVDHRTPEAVLGASTAEQVEDVVTRGEFWRWRTTVPDDCTVEAYLWGIGTSPTARALSMLLMPFTLVNVAYWARPARQHGVVSWAADSSAGFICRLLGLTLTATLVLAAAGASMDLVAWQCLGVEECTQRWPQPFNLAGEADLSVGQRLVAGAVVPLLLLVMLWYYSYRTWQRYERRVHIGPRQDQLTGARFWRGAAWVQRLRGTHVLAGMAVVDALLVYPLAASDAHHGSRPAWVGYALLAAVAVMAAVAVAGAVAPLPIASLSVKHPSQAPDIDPRWYRAAVARAVDRTGTIVETFRAAARSASSPVTLAVRRMAWVGLGVTLAATVYAAWPRPAVAPPNGSVPGYVGFAVVLSVLQVILLFGLGAVTVPLSWAARRARRHAALGGFAGPVIASTAVMLAAAESAGLLYFAALSVGQLRPSGAGRAWEPAPPYPYEWAGLGFALALAASVVAGCALLLTWRGLVRAGARLTDRRDPGLRPADPYVAELLDHAHARGRVLERVPRLALVVFTPVAVLSLVGVDFSVLGRGPSVLLPSPALANLGTWSIGILAVLVVYLVARTGTMTPVRRTISAIWALATFWPRAAHPFAAPAHGPRAVADIVSRVSWLARQGTPVLISAHSHGALLATIAAPYLPADVAARTALLTSASPAARLIEPYFGAFIDRTTFQEVVTALTGPGGTRWRNLYRITDPIGGPIFGSGQPAAGGHAGAVDRLAPDPPTTAVGLGVDPTPRGHGDYLHDPVFSAEHTALVDWLARDLRAGASGLPSRSG
ncbi:MAG TPA: hypothetical protein VFM54_12440 [Micromonosporaceae bacterium]|nr:hypothetical protein [Micromonosporaceae bacterium]